MPGVTKAATAVSQTRMVAVRVESKTDDVINVIRERSDAGAIKIDDAELRLIAHRIKQVLRRP